MQPDVILFNNQSQPELRCEFAGPPVSAFQKKIRGECTVLRDHVCKQMNELNLERCRCIPKEVPGADWRCLEQLVAQDPAREMYKVAPVLFTACAVRLYVA